jgi:hypothetical protein
VGIAGGRDGVCRWGRSSATGEAVSVGGFDDEASRGHGREAFVERGGADAAGGAQFGERPGLVAVCEGCGDALVNGGRCHVALWRVIGPDRLEGEDVVSLGKLESNAGDGGRGAMLDSEDDTIIAVAAEIDGVTLPNRWRKVRVRAFAAIFYETNPDGGVSRLPQNMRLSTNLVRCVRRVGIGSRPDAMHQSSLS